MQLLSSKTTISSLELVEQINIFRKEDGNKNDLEHKNLLVVIRDEFSDEINELKIQPVDYKDYERSLLIILIAKSIKTKHRTG